MKDTVTAKKALFMVGTLFFKSLIQQFSEIQNSPAPILRARRPNPQAGRVIILNSGIVVVSRQRLRSSGTGVVSKIRLAAAVGY
jgi:hypothetical protein